MALAVLAMEWARARGGHAVGLIVDHGLRAESRREAAKTADCLAALGMAAEILAIDLTLGPSLSVRARRSRHDALEGACARRGILHLLLGHHANDQAETVVMRVMAGSREAGRAGMAALVETARLRLLRPLLMVPHGRLRALLRARGIDWVEDPSNRDPCFIRSRLRAYRADPDGDSAATSATAAAARLRGMARAAHERETARWLAAHAEIHPEGYAVIPDAPIPADALAGLIRMIAGSRRPPRGGVADLARAPRPATLGGVRVLPAGRLAPGRWLLVREARAMAAAIPACPGAVWDGRFQLAGNVPPCAMLGGLGADASKLPGRDLPACVRYALPALRVNGALVAVPHLRYGIVETPLAFRPVAVAAGAPFQASPVGWRDAALWGCQAACETLC